MIPGVVLAAGDSTRMGRPKALLPIGQPPQPFVERVARTLLQGGVDDVIVVVGALAAQIANALQAGAVPVRVVENRGYARGQLSSLVTALEAVDRPGVRAVVVLPVDMPLVSPDTVRTVLQAYRSNPHPIVRPCHEGRHGHPVVFDRSLFGDLRAADPALGARVVIASHEEFALEVEVGDPGAYRDIDTPEEFERYVGPRTG